VSLYVQYASSGLVYQFTTFGGLTTNFDWQWVTSSPTGLTTGIYNNQPLTSLAGVAVGIQCQIVVSGGVVTAIVATASGTNAVATDTYSFSLTPMGGTGVGLIYTTASNPSLDDQGTLLVDAYGTGGTTGTGGAGTYQLAAGGGGVLGAANNPSSALSNGYLSVAEWVIYAGSTPPPGQIYLPPGNIMSPSAPEYSALGPFKFAGPASLAPPYPLPLTSTGTNTTTSYST
jgi:hypothetical protein